MNKLRTLLLIIMVAAGMLIIMPAAGVEAAWNPFAEVCNNGGSGSAVCEDRGPSGGNPLTGSDGVIMKIVNIIAVIAGAAAVIIIILAGLRYVTSGGSSDDLVGAKRTLIYAVVGIIVIVLARTIVAFTLGKV